MPPLLIAIFLLNGAVQGAAAQRLAAQGASAQGGAAGARGVPAVAGIVVDAQGAPVAEATVRLEISRVAVDEKRTTGDGRFAFAVDVVGEARLVVIATGFAQASAPVSGDSRGIQITLQPARFFEAVNVTSSRGDVPRADPTTTITVFTSAELFATAAVSLDDALKVVPGFTLFRRTSSRVSNPTAQGVTLRGLGGTGSSRSLVLADGVPLNDAFGGWVYWDKVPQAAIDRVEVERGSGSDLYGADAVGGVIQILTLHPGGPAARALVEAGGLGTGRVSLFGAGRSRGWSYNAAGQWFKTDGYVTVAEEARQDAGIKGAGPIDTRAGSTHRSALASAGYQAANGWSMQLRGSVFTEDRQNGTPAVINATSARQGSGEITAGLRGGLLAARVFGGTQGYDQTFSAVSPDRTTEDLNRRQHVPTRFVGTGAQWVRPIARHTLLFGAEAKFIKGDTQETRLAQGRVLGASDDGGTQQVGSAFLQGNIVVSDRITMVVGAHADGWHTDSQNTAYHKTLGSFNPRSSLSYSLRTGIALRASAYGGFRAPTLNELYRDFRAGNTQTNHNEMLRPERLKGADGGVVMARGRASIRVTGFWNVLDDAITNITLSTTPTLITKQRDNADRLRSIGVELEGDVALPGALSVAFTGAIVNARFKGATSLRDNRVPQVPTGNAGLSVRYSRKPWAVSGQIRVTGRQFEDDLNLFTLRRATVLDLYGSRRLVAGASAFVAVENLFDSVYDVGRTPILTTGLPRAARAGVQISLP